jgi:PhnB protein
MMTYKGSPMAEEVPPEWGHKIMHAHFVVDDQVLMGADSLPESYQTPQSFFVHLGFNDPVEAERVFHALAEKGTIQMPIQETFWASRFGMLVDQFGTPWAINCEPAA